MLPIILQGLRKATDASKRGRQAKGIARVAAWLTVVAAFGTGLALKSAKADVTSGSLMVGRELNALIDEESNTDVLNLKLNGQLIHMRQSVQPRSVHEVVAEYETFCREHPSSFADVWVKGPFDNAPPGTPGGTASLQGGVLKAENDTDGMLMCFSKGGKSSGSLEKAMEVFEKTGDLGAIGELRYVYVKKAGAGSSKVMAVWTDSSFNLQEIAVPEGKEARGTDTQVPRPEGARRVIDAQVLGTPYGVKVYEVKQSREDVGKFYDTWAKSTGFRALAPQIDPAHQEMRGYFRGDSQVLVSVFTNSDGRSYLSVAEVSPKLVAPLKATP